MASEKQAGALIREFADAEWAVRRMKEFADEGRIADKTLSDSALQRFERAARSLFKALTGRRPTRDELDDILY